MTAEVVQQQQEDPVYCICRGPEAGFMVFCDGCEEWFHGDCVGIKKRQADKLAKYLCPKCSPPEQKETKPATPDAETSKSRSGRAIKKKKWDEEEFEYDFKNKDEDEDYQDEDDDEEDEKPKPPPRRQSSSSSASYQSPPPRPLSHQPLASHSHSHLQHPQHIQHSLIQPQHQLIHPQHQHQQQQQQFQQMPAFVNHNNHFAHPNHFNIIGHPGMHQIGNHLNVNPTIQAINSINQFNNLPTHHAAPVPPPPLAQPLPSVLPTNNVPTNNIDTNNNNNNSNKRAFNSSQGPSPKPSPEGKPKMVRRESFPPTKGTDNKKTNEQEKEKEKEKEKDKDKDVNVEEASRQKAKQNLTEALGNAEIASAIESEVFRLFPKSAEGQSMREFNNKIRSLMFNLQKNTALKERTLSGDISPARFVTMRPEDYANQELSDWRKAHEVKSLQSVAIRPEDDEEQAAKLQAMVRQMESKEKGENPDATEASTTESSESVKGEVANIDKDKSDEEEKGEPKTEKESVDIDIDIDTNPNLATPLALPVAAGAPLPPPIPLNASSSSTGAASTILPPPPSISNVPVWAGAFDKVAVDVEPFSAKAYHIGGPHVTDLMAQITSISARGKLDMPKLADFLESIDESPHRTRSLILFEPTAVQDDESYEMTWEYYRNNKSPIVVCSTSPDITEDEDSTQPRLDSIYMVPLSNPDDIPDVVFPPSIASRKVNLRVVGQRPSTRTRLLVAIVITRLPDPSKAGKPEGSPPSMSISPVSSPQHNQPQQQQNPQLNQQPHQQSPPHLQHQQMAQQQYMQQQQHPHQHQQQGFQQNYNLPPSQMYQNHMYHPNMPPQQQQFQQFHPQQQFQQFPHQQQFPPHHPMFNNGNGHNQFYPQYNNNNPQNFQQNFNNKQ